ncbi:MAG TPA: hypothetical protein VNA25_12250 [Phycisphaerae bacterium]|nr:hypothetical protein [Phycisphaerae bacterium]
MARRLWTAAVVVERPLAREYNIAKTSGLCGKCGRELTPGEEFIAVLIEPGEELQRQDFCGACWDQRPGADDPGVLGEWRSRVPDARQKKRLFVDDEILIDFFQRLEGADEPARVSFRFVLALILMRKKLLVYDKADKLPDGRDVWSMHLRGGEQTFSVIDPHMDEQRIADVSQRLGEILEGEL